MLPVLGLVCLLSGCAGAMPKAGEHYRLVESSLGPELRASLENARGQAVAEAKNFDCLPG